MVENLPRDVSSAFFVATWGGRQLRLVGELDIAGIPTLRPMLADVDGDIELDCSQLTFIDCSGLRLLQETHGACEAKGVHLYLIGPARCLTRLLDLTGLNGFFDVRDGSNS